MSKSLTSNLTPSPKNNGTLPARRRAEARLAAAFRRAVRELDRCCRRSGEDHRRTSAVLRELGRALRQYHGKGPR